MDKMRNKKLNMELDELNMELENMEPLTEEELLSWQISWQKKKKMKRLAATENKETHRLKLWNEMAIMPYSRSAHYFAKQTMGCSCHRCRQMAASGKKRQKKRTRQEGLAMIRQELATAE